MHEPQHVSTTHHNDVLETTTKTILSFRPLSASRPEFLYQLSLLSLYIHAYGCHAKHITYSVSTVSNGATFSHNCHRVPSEGCSVVYVLSRHIIGTGGWPSKSSGTTLNPRFAWVSVSCPAIAGGVGALFPLLSQCTGGPAERAHGHSIQSEELFCRPAR